MLAASALLIAAGLYRSVGRADHAAALVHEHLPKLEQCAELHLNLAVHHGETDRLPRALELAPKLAADAREAKVPTAESAAADRCEDPQGPVAWLRTLEAAMHALVTAEATAALTGIHAAPDPVDLPDPGVDALVIAQGALAHAVTAAREIEADVQAAINRLKEEARRTRERAGHAEQELTRLAPQHQIANVEEALCQAEHRWQEAVSRREEAQAALGSAQARRQAAQSALQESERRLAAARQAAWDAANAEDDAGREAEARLKAEHDQAFRAWAEAKDRRDDVNYGSWPRRLLQQRSADAKYDERWRLVEQLEKELERLHGEWRDGLAYERYTTGREDSLDLGEYVEGRGLPALENRTSQACTRDVRRSAGA